MSDNFSGDQRICDAATGGLDAIDNHVITMYLDDANDDGLVGVFKREADAIFFVEARTGWPAALTEIERLRRGYDKLREYVEQQAAEGWSAPNALLDEIDAEEVSVWATR